MKKNKGISLIVLVITIIIMIILAAAVILSLNSSDVVSKANEAKEKNDLSNMKDAAILIEAELQAATYSGQDLLGGKSKEDYFKEKLQEKGFDITKSAIYEENNNIVIEEIKVKDIVADGRNAYFILNNGDLIGCGNNEYGQIGIGDLVNKATPQKMPVTGVKQVDTGFYSTYMLLKNGTVKFCGYNYSSVSSGLGSAMSGTTRITDIMQIPENTLSSVYKITVKGKTKAFAFMDNGLIKAWGVSGYYYATGLPGGSNVNVPTQMPETSLKNVKEIITRFLWPICIVK